jgi:hypothetical protein
MSSATLENTTLVFYRPLEGPATAVETPGLDGRLR